MYLVVLLFFVKQYLCRSYTDEITGGNSKVSWLCSFGNLQLL
jgi:hypothetical protein